MNPKSGVYLLFHRFADKKVMCKYCKAKYKVSNATKMRNLFIKYNKCLDRAKAQFVSWPKTSGTIASEAIDGRLNKQNQKFNQVLLKTSFIDSMSSNENVKQSFRICNHNNFLIYFNRKC